MIDIRFEQENNQAAAYDGGKQIGVCQYQVLPDRWIINHTYTDPEYAGQGIARKMVECVEKQAELAQIKLEATCWYAKKVLHI